jgi:Tol biopolymer transport system component
MLKAKANLFRTLTMLAAAALAAGLLAVIAASEPAQAAYPGANGKIAFASWRATGEGVDNPEWDFEIFTMNPDGTEITQLTKNGKDVHDFWPAWSPDGEQITFTRCGGEKEELSPGDCNVYKMNADGTNQTNLTNNNGANDFNSDWSPDAEQIAFASCRMKNTLDLPSSLVIPVRREFSCDIYKMNADGTNRTNLTNDAPTGEEDPRWSPDGQQIVFEGRRERDGGQTHIYKMDADGRNVTRLSDNTVGPDVDPAWSPDGQQIVFSSAREGDDQLNIYTMNADGSGVSKITDGFGDDFFGNGQPHWSPDGQQITFRGHQIKSDWDVQSEIYTMRADGTNQTNVTNNPAVEDTPDWQPLAPTPETKTP